MTEATTNFEVHEKSGMAEKIREKLKPVTDVFLAFTNIVLFVMLMLTVVDVTGRTLFSMPVLGSIELIEILMALAAFPAFSYVQRRGTQLRVDLVFSKMPPKWQAVIDVFTNATCTVFMGVLAYNMLWQVQDAIDLGFSTVILEISHWPFILYAGICIFVLAFFLFLDTMVSLHKSIARKASALAFLSLGLSVVLSVVPFLYASSCLSFSKPGLGGIMMCYLFVLLILGMPIGLAMASIGIQGLVLLLPSVDIALSMAAGSPYHSVAHYTMSVVPMFILMGELALFGDISTDLFNVANKWMGRLPGGLAVATICGCAGFAAVCGDSLPTAMTMATVSLPAMTEKKYDRSFATACLCVGGPLGILIPPSMGFIIYAIITEESVGRLFMAGIFPGILLTVVLCFIVMFRAIRNPSLAPRGEHYTLTEKLKCLPGILPMVFLFVVIIGGILTGVCTPTEGGAVGSFATLLYCLVRRRITLKKLWHALTVTANLTGLVFVIILGVGILNFLLSSSRVPFVLSDFIMEAGFGKYTLMLAIVIMYLILGMLMNVIPMIMLTMPAIFPTVQAMGYDPIWFGVVVVMLMELGQITPPIGVIVFAMSSVVPDVPIGAIFKQATPFFLGILLTIFLLVLFPDIALWLPNYLFSGV